MNFKERYNDWLSSSIFDDKTKEELLALEGNYAEIEDRFYKDLEFGTGGLRAVVGAGTNRLNKYTIRRITHGYGIFLLNKYGEEAKKRGVVIAHDMRYGSTEFTIEAARTFAALEIKTYLFKEITTTPELSFAVPKLKAVGGVVITASHNPPKYNGYKIYDSTGCQATPNLANQVISEINNIRDYGKIPTVNETTNLISWVNDSLNTDFVEAVKSQMIHPNVIKEVSNDFKVLYTPFHGTGRKPIFRILKEVGFNKVFTVEAQLLEDPEFGTVKSPNPEEITAFDMAVKVARENDVDLIMGTDPDCDRVGALVKVDNNYAALNGNQLGSLLVYYMITTNIDKIEKMKNPYIVKTIVTSDLGKKIANHYGITSYDTLTGFKYIGEKINNLRKEGDFLMGYEESYGYLVGTHARDKDGVGSALLIAEMASYYYTKGKTLFVVLEDIYKKFGYYKEELISFTLEGQSGIAKIQRMMSNLRNLSVEEKAKVNIYKINDYSLGVNDLPKSDVLKFFFSDGSWVAVRPSGTEPKIKFYLSVFGEDRENADEKLLKLKELVLFFNNIKAL